MTLKTASETPTETPTIVGVSDAVGVSEKPSGFSNKITTGVAPFSGSFQTAVSATKLHVFINHAVHEKTAVRSDL